MKTKNALLFTLAAGLLSCSNLPSNIVISPEILPSNIQQNISKSAELAVIDRRNNVHILQIMKENKAVNLLNSQSPLEGIIHNELKASFVNPAFVLSVNDLPVKMNVYIDTALINVEQELLNYSSTNTIKVQVELSKGNVKLSKTYQQKGASKGPMIADLAVLERDFSQHLGNVIQNILLDKELRDFINS